VSGRRLKVVVGGYVVAFPLAGMAWHHLHYIAGLYDLGHEVTFFEDGPSWAPCYDPEAGRSGPGCDYGRRWLEAALAEAGLPIRWCYASEALGRCYGLSREDLDAALARADLLICVSGVTPLREDRPRPRRTVVIDTDPVYTQLRMERDPSLLAYYRGFDAVATFGRLVGTDASPLPRHGLTWLPTAQPVSLERWPALAPAVGGPFTTIARWEHGGREVELGGRRLRSAKTGELERLIDLPGRAKVPLELAMQQMPAAAAERFRAHGWAISSALEATRDTAALRAFLARSAGEIGVAKEIYAAVPSGWFGDRSALYLASGRPVIAQSTGFERWLPVGEGLLAFRTPEEAAAALAAVAREPARHAAAARAIAERCFDAKKVLAELIERVV
jgi:hypothetical protein